MSSVILEAHDLTKEYRHTVALDHIDLKIERRCSADKFLHYW